MICQPLDAFHIINNNIVVLYKLIYYILTGNCSNGYHISYVSINNKIYLRSYSLSFPFLFSSSLYFLLFLTLYFSTLLNLCLIYPSIFLFLSSLYQLFPPSISPYCLSSISLILLSLGTGNHLVFVSSSQRLTHSEYGCSNTEGSYLDLHCIPFNLMF